MNETAGKLVTTANSTAYVAHDYKCKQVQLQQLHTEQNFPIIDPDDWENNLLRLWWC